MSLAWMGNDPDLHRPTRRVYPSARPSNLAFRPFTRRERLDRWLGGHPLVMTLAIVAIYGGLIWAFIWCAWKTKP